MAFLTQLTGVSGGPHGNGHYVLWISPKVFNDLPIKMWKYNRPPDEDRVKEIRAYMETSNRMDGIVYLACLDDELVCYESNHRRQALKQMDDVTNMSHILVDVLENATHEKIRNEFNRLNKAVSVPEIYVVNEPEISVEDLNDLVKSFCKNYAFCKVNTNHPQRPHFNRDMVADEFYRVMKENHIGVDEFVRRLTELNRRMSFRDKAKLTPKIIEKCQRSGLWLFAWSSKLNAKELME
jgi:hypothetical protein